jgi:DNA-binding transcriptional LysR family regulator
LLVLLAVARRRTFSAAAGELGLDHTTVARRVKALEAAVGGRLLVETPGGWDLSPLGESACEAARGVEAALAGLGREPRAASAKLHGLVRVTAPEIFMREVVAPAVAAVSRNHADLQFELISVTRPTPQHGPTADLDIGVTRATSRRLATRRLGDYQLGLFAARSYLASHGPIRSRADLRDHNPVYYVESMLQVVDLDVLDQFFPRRRALLGATSVEAQLCLVMAGAGVGLLPRYFASKQAGLEPVLPEEAAATLTYWMTGRPANLRRSEVTAVAEAIAHHTRQVLGDAIVPP